MSRFAASVLMAGVMCCVAASAAADPVRITSGEFRFDHEGDHLNFSGDSFQVRYDISTFGNFVPVEFPDNNCYIPFVDERCSSGEVVDMSFRTPGEVDLAPGNAIVDGTTFPDLTLRGELEFSVDPILLTDDMPQGFLPLESPFTFRGSIRGFEAGAEVFARDLVGNGTMLVGFTREGDTFFGEAGRTDYLFEATAPVPEPATMVLLGTGLAGLMAGARKRRRAVGEQLRPDHL